MPIILSRPTVAPPVPVNQWVGMTVAWHGADGSVWDLAGGGEGVVLENTGTEGLHDPVISKYSSASRVVPGKRPRGWRTEPRDVFWPLLLWSGVSGDEWKERYDAFFRSIHPEIPGVWRVGHGGTYRELELTGVYRDGHSFGNDPLVFGWEKFSVELEAVQPYWSGEPLQMGPWYQPQSGQFFGASGAPDFYLSTTSEIGRAYVNNPGDVEAWMTWTLTGPLTDIEIGIGGTVAAVPFDLADGEVLVIDTDPRHQSGTLDGVDVTTALGLLRYGAIPPGSEVEIHVQAGGLGSISAELVPLYFRAF